MFHYHSIKKVIKFVVSVYNLRPDTFSVQDNFLEINFKSRPVSYYAFFKGWLLPSPPPGCYGYLTSFIT